MHAVPAVEESAAEQIAGLVFGIAPVDHRGESLPLGADEDSL